MDRHTYSSRTITNVIKSIEEELKNDTTNLSLTFLMLQWADCLKKVKAELEPHPHTTDTKP